MKIILALKLIAVINAAGLLLWHLLKVLLLKILKTLGIRYGLFISQRRWYSMRKIKVIFYAEEGGYLERSLDSGQVIK